MIVWAGVFLLAWAGLRAIAIRMELLGAPTPPPEVERVASDDTGRGLYRVGGDPLAIDVLLTDDHETHAEYRAACDGAECVPLAEREWAIVRRALGHRPITDW